MTEFLSQSNPTARSLIAITLPSPAHLYTHAQSPSQPPDFPRKPTEKTPYMSGLAKQRRPNSHNPRVSSQAAVRKALAAQTAEGCADQLTAGEHEGCDEMVRVVGVAQGGGVESAGEADDEDPGEKEVVGMKRREERGSAGGCVHRAGVFVADSPCLRQS
jgi:hypothetical protein